MSYLYILEINPLSVVSFANIFSHAEGCLFVLFMVSFAVQKLLSLISPICLFLFLFLLYNVEYYLALKRKEILTYATHGSTLKTLR